MRFVFSLAAIVCVACCQPALAQSSFEPGAVILNSGDTIKGQIDNRDWLKNPKKITHRNTSGGTTQYTPLDVKSFYLTQTGEWYDAAIVSVDKSSQKQEDILRNVNVRGVKADTVFLRRVVSGRVTLYVLMDEYSRLHLVAKKNDVLDVLKVEMKRVLEPREAVITVERYKGQLAAMTADCTTKKFDVNELKYTEKAVSDFVKRYNECFSSSTTASQEPEESGFDFTVSLVGAANYSAMRLEAPGASPPVDRRFDPDITPAGGIGAELIFPRNRRSYSLAGDLMYRYYSMEGLYEAYQLKFSTIFRYNVPLSDNARPFFGAGLTTAWAFKVKSQLAEYRVLEQGIAGEAGYFFGRMSGWLRYERTSGFSPYIGVKTSFNNWYLCFSYRLTK